MKISKLVDGSLVISKSNDDMLLDVVSIMIFQQENSLSVELVPYFFPFDTEMNGTNISVSKVLTSMDAPQEMIDRYVMATSGIIPASSVPNNIKPSLKSVK